MAIILVEIGLDEKASASALAAGFPVTLVVSPYADGERGWYRSARWAGHETLLQLPVRPLGFPTDDAGPLSLEPDATPNSRLDVVLARGIGYLGVFVAAGQFAARPAAFDPIAGALASRGLALVEVGSGVLEPLARYQRLPYLNLSKAVDREPSPEAIDAALAALEVRAREDGFAAGYGRPFAITIERLVHWAAGLHSRGVSLVGVGELLDRAVEGKGSKP
ncbi:MAG: divergent polysaccharide deacetylase family protein [Geminicoccaceae bacterium]|nr:divergent polysaccharide deacetylase family protein [Geminicoccaceae bacterium]